MNRTTNILTLTTAILATIVITMIVSPADASKRYAIETGDIAFVDVFKLIDKALIGDEKFNERNDFNTKSSEAIGGLQGQQSALKAQLGQMDQSDPNAAATYQQYQQVSQQLDSASQQINNAYQTLIAQQLASAYTEIYAAANTIGAENGYIFVFATRTDGELIQTDTITGITQEILARPLMTPPTGVDITELVRVKLGYPEKAPEPIIAEPTPEAEPVTEPMTETSPEAMPETAGEPVTESPVTEDE